MYLALQVHEWVSSIADLHDIAYKSLRHSLSRPSETESLLLNETIEIYKEIMEMNGKDLFYYV